MPVPLDEALAQVRARLLDSEHLVRALASGRRRHHQTRWRRVEIRPVQLKGGRRLQVVTYDETQAFTRTLEPGSATATVDEVLSAPFAHWHVEHRAGDGALVTTQIRVTKRGDAQVSTRSVAVPPEVVEVGGHDRVKQRLLAPHDPFLVAVGVSDHRGVVKPSRQAKYRQVEEFLRLLGPAIDEAAAGGDLPVPGAADALRVVDLGCGNAYLTFAAYRYLTEVRGYTVQMLGIDTKETSALRNTGLAASLGCAEQLRFATGRIGDVTVDPAPHVALALHACDTATDDALAQAIAWQAPVVLSAPCCHHYLQTQLRERGAPAPYTLLTRDGILRERLADTLTDALRAALVRMSGYHVDVVQFVESRHTPRNTLLRGVRTRAGDASGVSEEYAALVAQWHVQPKLAELLGVRSGVS
ncbi:MAG: class I SAM-dependent methyltransferase [Nocardioidaceae bacterium]